MDRPEPWWPLEWDGATTAFSYGRLRGLHPLVSLVCRDYLRNITEFVTYDQIVVVDYVNGIADDLTVRCILLDLAYPQEKRDERQDPER